MTWKLKCTIQNNPWIKKAITFAAILNIKKTMKTQHS